MQQVFKVRLSDGTETFVNDRLLDELEREREAETSRGLPRRSADASQNPRQDGGREPQKLRQS